MSPSPRTPSTRAEQRRKTEARILSAARDQFAQFGYERATIRRVAAAARVDPGLVMHYFGSKQGLFVRAAEHPPHELAGQTPATVADSMLTALRQRLANEPTASLAVLRSMLTHEEAAETYRAANAFRLEQLAGAVSGPDAALRATLLTAIIQGVIVQRWLLGQNQLADAKPDDIINLLRPCFEALIAPN